MSTTQDVAAPDAPVQQSGSRSWGNIAVNFTGQMARADFRRGDLAELRRMNPDGPYPAAFWKLLAQYDLLGSHTLESKWALILHGIALMTPTSTGDGNARTAHDGHSPVGRALYLGGESQRTSALYSETRLNRLLTARGPMLQTLLARMFRMLAAANVSFNWREMAQFILNEGYGQEAAEQGRRRIARAYYDAARRNSPAPVSEHE